MYEQLYDTLDISGSAEIRAHATAKVSPLHPIAHGSHSIFLMLVNLGSSFMIFAKSLYHPYYFLFIIYLK